MTTTLVLGIDEAGRGPGLGPMVLAAVALDEKTADRLAAHGVRDSKAFGSSVAARRKRAILKEAIEERAAWVGLEVCSVRAIDDYVSRGALNLLERERAVRLIESAPTWIGMPATGMSRPVVSCTRSYSSPAG